MAISDTSTQPGLVGWFVRSEAKIDVMSQRMIMVETAGRAIVSISERISVSDRELC